MWLLFVYFCNIQPCKIKNARDPPNKLNKNESALQKFLPPFYLTLSGAGVSSLLPRSARIYRTPLSDPGISIAPIECMYKEGQHSGASAAPSKGLSRGFRLSALTHRFPLGFRPRRSSKANDSLPFFLSSRIHFFPAIFVSSFLEGKKGSTWKKYIL